MGEEEEGEGEREQAGGHTGLQFFFLAVPQRSLYGGLQSPGAAPGPALGSFAFLPAGPAGALAPSAVAAPLGSLSPTPSPQRGRAGVLTGAPLSQPLPAEYSPGDAAQLPLQPWPPTRDAADATRPA